MKPFFVYMLCCSDSSFYIGHTDDLALRMAQHHHGELPGYTQTRRPVKLVWSQETATRDEALAAERQIKGWSRAKKEALIAGDWSEVSFLARCHTGLRQAQPERTTSDHAEPVEAQAQDDRASFDCSESVKGQTQPERRER